MQPDRRGERDWTQFLLGCAVFAPPLLVVPGLYALRAMGWPFLGLMVWAGVVFSSTFVLVLPWARVMIGPFYYSCIIAAGIAFVIFFGWALVGLAFLYVLCSNERF